MRKMGGDECHHPLHIFFFPFLASGHIIPTVDMAKSFAAKGVKATIITTPLNAPLISKAIQKSKTTIHIQTIEFPNVEDGLPKGCENMDSLPSPFLVPTFIKATRLFQEPFEQLLLQQHPNCVIADVLFPWATDSTAKFAIPRLVFHGTSFFSLCANECIRLYNPCKNVSSDTETFIIPNLPGQIKLTRMQMPGTDFFKFLEEVTESEVRSYGVVVNSFYELEGVYADHYRNVIGRKAWHIGPLSLCSRNDNIKQKATRGKEASIDQYECLKWLDTKKQNSVVYICFGSMPRFPGFLLREIAMGLEASGKPFIWVVREGGEEDASDELLNIEERLQGKGLIIKGWAPQVLILEHEAIGAFVTHCGWNSTLEAVVAGVPIVTWPIVAEQFYNEKLVTEVLQIGVPVGAKKWGPLEEDRVKWDEVEKALRKIMEGEEAEEIRNKAKVLSKQAMHAVEEGGSSCSDLNALIDELGLLN
ncbi:probable UDP-glucosyl transferase 73B6 [Lotus japonicus]|uniref:probable UDP-glucosyl transferase 73B6 n=1 Tax=Lotus japonicus TaxID=34305 RepID=UPI0025847A4F|nr:probable UDP-glucosyl transferase 73B6 [Lotus japonicus]